MGFSAAVRLTSQEPSGIALAKVIDQEILQLSDLPDNRQLVSKWYEHDS
jgi:hypothetical protein